VVYADVSQLPRCRWPTSARSSASSRAARVFRRLGILAGDHLKSASDLGIPLTAVGLAYRRGYFRQYLNADGWQQEQYPEADYYNLPLMLERRPDGAPVTIEVDYPGRKVQAQIWRAQVGRVPLYLLDTDLPSNGPEDRAVTGYLYGGIRTCGSDRKSCSGSRGPCAGRSGDRAHRLPFERGPLGFLALERVRRTMENKGGIPGGEELVTASNVFTTPHARAAGIDVFAPDLMDRYFSAYQGGLGLSREQFFALGRQNPADQGEPFSMAVLAIRLSSATNGVSKLHGRVSRKMWAGLWPGVPADDLPITSVTNGVHVRGWLSHDMAGLFDAYLGPHWISHPADQSVWSEWTRSRMQSCGGPTSGGASAWWLCATASRDATRAARRAAGPTRKGRGGPRSQGAHHRIRPALRHLQARHAVAQEPGAAGPAPLGRPAAGPDHLRGQGAPKG